MSRLRRGPGRVPSAPTLIVLAVATSSCGGTPGRAATDADLRGRSFVAVEASHHTFVAGVEVTIGFSEGSGTERAGLLSSRGGCNPATGTYTIERGRLRRPEYNAPLAGCDGLLVRQDEWLNGLLGDGPRAEIQDGGETLVLSTDDDTVTFKVRVTTHDGAS